MANEQMLLQNINLLSEEQFRNIPEEDIKKEELYMIPLFNADGQLVYPDGSTMWIAKK